MREDNAAVASGAFEGTQSGGGCHFAYGSAGARFDFVDGALHCHRHVGARVAIRHGKDVQGIYVGLVLLQQGSTREEHILEQRAAYRHFFQIVSPPKGAPEKGARIQRRYAAIRLCRYIGVTR
ncbi:hypothetical protein SDC9_183214 [bioreactor metagenome]|uniref:Uncharacterized protein n=1 Tax=bioreactor metagenome TaxID=1076179 RepID=A0A645HB29_9ZZZZ